MRDPFRGSLIFPGVNMDLPDGCVALQSGVPKDRMSC